MDDLSDNKTFVVAANESFVPVSSNSSELTDKGNTEENFPDQAQKGIYGYTSDFVETFEKKFSTATFALIIVGYIIMASFGKNNVNMLQYLAAILIGFIAFIFLKYPKEIVQYLKRLSSYPLYYIPLAVMILLLVTIYFFYGKPAIYFYKDTVESCQNANLKIEAKQ